MRCEASFWRLSGADSHVPLARQHPWDPQCSRSLSLRGRRHGCAGWDRKLQACSSSSQGTAEVPSACAEPPRGLQDGVARGPHAGAGIWGGTRGAPGTGASALPARGQQPEGPGQGGDKLLARQAGGEQQKPQVTDNGRDSLSLGRLGSVGWEGEERWRFLLDVLSHLGAPSSCFSQAPHLL